MANYGLTTDDKKYGSGSFLAPYGSTSAKTLFIQPQSGENFAIASGQDFIISVWIKYTDRTFDTRAPYAPIVGYGGATSAANHPFEYWGLGFHTLVNNGVTTIRPYFQYDTFYTQNNQQLVQKDYITASLTLTNATANMFGQWCNWKIQRSGSTITFTFTDGAGNVQTNTATYSGSIGTTMPANLNGLYVGPTNPVSTNTSATNGAYIDELFFARGTSTVTSRHPTTNAIYDGALSTTALLYQFDGNYLDDQSGLQQGAAALTSAFTQTTNASARKVGSAGLTAAATISARPAGTVSINSALTSSSSLSSTARSTRTGTSTLTSTSTVTVAANKLKLFEANLSGFGSATLTAFATHKTYRPYTIYSATGGTLSYAPIVSTGSLARLSTTQAKYGTGSLYVPGYNQSIGTGSYAVIEPQATSNGFPIDGDFYLSFWTYFNSTPTNPGTGVYVPIFSIPGLDMGYYSTGIDPYLRSTTGNFTTQTITATSITSGTWQRWEVWRIGSTITFKFNGSTKTATRSGLMYGGSIGYVYIGHRPSGLTPIPIYFDEVFFSIGTNSVQTTKGSGEIGDGSLSTTQFLYHFNGDAIDDITGIQTASANLSGAFALSAITGQTASATAALTSTATVTATANRIKVGTATVTSNSSITANISVIRQAAADITLTTNIDVTGIRVRYGQAALDSTTTVTTTAVKTVRTGIDLTGFATVVAVTARRLASTASMFAVTTLTADTKVVRVAESHLENSVILTADARKTVQVSANLTTNSSSSIQIDVFKRISADLTLTSTQSTRADRFAQFAAHLENSTTLTARPLQDVRVSMQITSALTVNAGVLVYAASVMHAKSKFVFIYDPTHPTQAAELTYIVPRESRTWTIDSDTKLWTITKETRTYTIEQEQLSWTIENEDRIYNFEGY